MAQKSSNSHSIKHSKGPRDAVLCFQDGDYAEVHLVDQEQLLGERSTGPSLQMMINSPNIHMGGTQLIVLLGVARNDTGLEIYIGEHEYYAELGRTRQQGWVL